MLSPSKNAGTAHGVAVSVVTVDKAKARFLTDSVQGEPFLLWVTKLDARNCILKTLGSKLDVHNCTVKTGFWKCAAVKAYT